MFTGILYFWVPSQNNFEYENFIDKNANFKVAFYLNFLIEFWTKQIKVH